MYEYEYDAKSPMGTAAPVCRITGTYIQVEQLVDRLEHVNDTQLEVEVSGHGIRSLIDASRVSTAVRLTSLRTASAAGGENKGGNRTASARRIADADSPFWCILGQNRPFHALTPP